MDIEELIRATQARQADRAVPAEQIRSALPRRVARAGRRRRLGRLGAVVAAAAVAAAITIPALTLRHNDTSQTTAPGDHSIASGAGGPQPTSGPAQFQDFRLGYRPTWVPPGYAEHIRSATAADPPDQFGPTLMRVWKKQVGPGDPWGGPELTLYVRTAVTDLGTAIDTSGQTVDINGNRGYYSAAPGDRKSSVAWSLSAHTLLMLTASHLVIPQQDLLRMARTVKPDPGPVAVPVHLRWLPAGWATTGVTVSGASAATWRGEVVAGTTAPEPTTDAQLKTGQGNTSSGSLSVVVGGTTDAPAGGATLSVGGHPARHPVRTDQAGKTLTYLVVDLGQGRLMTLVGDGAISLNELAKVAEQAQITPTGLDWLGA